MPEHEAKKNMISAQVVVTSVTAADLSEVTKELERAGFTVSGRVASNFSIAGAPERFEQYFKVHLEISKPGSVRVKGAAGEAAYELPLGALPEQVRKNVDKILFTRLPDFGAR